MPVLYLIPTPIADENLQTIPPYVQDIIRRLRVFIAERAKTARHFIKACAPEVPQQELRVAEVGKRADGSAAVLFQEAIREGLDVGLLSEAGCPGVADPGAAIVALAHREGIRVVPLVGPSSLLLALMASGMNGQRFAFHGYLSPKRPELARQFRQLEQQTRQQQQTQLFIETPYRSQMILEVALETLHPDTVFGIAQDLTGTGEWIRSLPVRDWKKQKSITLQKAPAVFLIGQQEIP
ncbi:MAG: SAM-dependent methyltransferase [Bacteroidetes bacterium]|nr:MAG: SAM-dependent methyltransferase [Bacteroidota bacterium]